MSSLIPQLEAAAQSIKAAFAAYESYDEGHSYPWENHLWRSKAFRRAHLDIIDARETSRLYMMHLTVFPHTNDPAPIFGFDLIAGPTKVTGAFHDLSPVAGGTNLDTWFQARAAQQQWSKERKLPEWAQQIFSPGMVAAGNIQDPEELARLIDFVLSNLLYYLDAIGRLGTNDYTAQQNHYCHWQKQNPHTPRVMSALGFKAEVVHEFIQNCLFPEL
jgi:hypothetical protein